MRAPAYEGQRSLRFQHTFPSRPPKGHRSVGSYVKISSWVDFHRLSSSQYRCVSNIAWSNPFLFDCKTKYPFSITQFCEHTSDYPSCRKYSYGPSSTVWLSSKSQFDIHFRTSSEWSFVFSTVPPPCLLKSSFRDPPVRFERYRSWCFTWGVMTNLKIPFNSIALREWDLQKLVVKLILFLRISTPLRRFWSQFSKYAIFGCFFVDFDGHRGPNGGSRGASRGVTGGRRHVPNPGIQIQESKPRTPNPGFQS